MLRIKNEKSNKITFFSIIDDEISIKKEFSIKLFIKINKQNEIENNNEFLNIEKNTKSFSKIISQSIVVTNLKSIVKTNSQSIVKANSKAIKKYRIDKK